MAILAEVVIVWLGCVAGWIVIGPPITGTERGAVAIVLGAAVIGDAPSPVFAARLDHAALLYREGRAEHILLTGGRSPEDRLSEAAAGARYLEARGVPGRALLLEEQSHTTRENLASAAQVLGGDAGLPVLIVSDPLHMRRAMAMAAAENLRAQASPTQTTRYRSWGTQAAFLAREVGFMHVHWLLGI